MSDRVQTAHRARQLQLSPELIAVRTARISDAPALFKLIKYWADRELMLVRPMNLLYEQIRDFIVAEAPSAAVEEALGGPGETMGNGAGGDESALLACGAMHVLWHDLGEIRGLAVAPEAQGLGLGRTIVRACESSARAVALPRVFAWTYQVPFFEKLGYRVTDRAALPPKVWSECNRCPFYENCNETAVLKELP